MFTWMGSGMPHAKPLVWPAGFVVRGDIEFALRNQKKKHYQLPSMFTGQPQEDSEHG